MVPTFYEIRQYEAPRHVDIRSRQNTTTVYWIQVHFGLLLVPELRLTISGFKLREQPGKYFVPGKVCNLLLMVWASTNEPQGVSDPLDGASQRSISSYK